MPKFWELYGISRLGFCYLIWRKTLNLGNGNFYVSTWLDHGVPRYLLRHYLSIPVWRFLDMINIWTGRPEERRLPSLTCADLIQSVWSLNRTKDGELMLILWLFAWLAETIPDCRPWEFSAFIISWDNLS